MYKLQKKPDKEFKTKNGSIYSPLATLKDEFGGVGHICIDDHCYVLYNGGQGRPFEMTAWWYKEAAEALKDLI